MKKKLNTQIIISYTLSIVSDVLLALLITLVFNDLIRNIFELSKIDLIQGYILLLFSKILFFKINEDEKKDRELYRAIFESFKFKMLKFIHYFLWYFAIKFILIF